MHVFEKCFSKTSIKCNNCKQKNLSTHKNITFPAERRCCQQAACTESPVCLTPCLTPVFSSSQHLMPSPTQQGAVRELSCPKLVDLASLSVFALYSTITTLKITLILFYVQIHSSYTDLQKAKSTHCKAKLV